MATIAELLDKAVRAHQTGELQKAEPLYRQILQLEPSYADAHHLLGLLAHQTEHREAALKLIRQAIALNPRVAVFHYNLGIVLKAQGQLVAAVESNREALRLNPDYVDALAGLGIILLEQGERADAIECFQRALAINPDDSEVHNNLGVAFRKEGRLDEAIACFQQALRLNPRYLDAINNLCISLLDKGDFAKAVEHNEQALRINPSHETTLWNRAVLRLRSGDFEGGWQDYELRPALLHAAPRACQRPRWDGTSLDGKIILIYAEQGFGDTLHFIRYLPLVQERGGTVLFECQAPLIPLLAGMPWAVQLIAAGDALPTFDVEAPLLSLPGIFHTTLTSIPAPIPYLHADPSLVEHWRMELAPLGGFKIGIAWQGNPHHQGDRYRSFGLAHFESLARVEGVRLVSLQKGPGADQLTAGFPVLDLSDRLDTAGAFLDTAAVMMNLDLVITVDSAVAHLAGALAIPVWVPLTIAPDWRWLIDRSDSPWYPTMRLFRQSCFGEWAEVFERIAAEVRGLIDSATAAPD